MKPVYQTDVLWQIKMEEAAIFEKCGPNALTDQFCFSWMHLPTSLSSWLLTVKICQPSHEFTFGVGISFIPYLLVLTPVV
jgi:hypothetical protein